MNLFGHLTFTQESLIDLLFKRLVILEVPIHARSTREFGKSRVARSIVRYAYGSLHVMLRAVFAYRPLYVFSVLGSFFAALGVTLLSFLFMHFLRTGRFSPQIWAGFVGGSFCFLAVSTWITGLLGDMLVRIRLTQEETLYELRRREPGVNSTPACSTVLFP